MRSGSAKNTKRILLVSASARMGGAERSMVELARAIDRSRFELSAVVGGGEGAVAEALSAAGVPVDVVEMPRLHRTLNPVRLARYAAAVSKAGRLVARLARSRGVDLVHANGIVSQVYAGEAAASAGVPCVWHARDMAGPRALVARLAGRAARVIAISGAVASHLTEAGAPAERVRVVLNGLDLSAFAELESRRSELRATARRELGLDETAFVAGSAGVFVPWKRHEDFIRAFAEICHRGQRDRRGPGPSVASAASETSVTSVAEEGPRAVLFGDDLFGENDAYVARLKRLADEIAPGRIVFAGFREGLARLLPALDVFVTASEKEPFGRVIVEAMAAGLPVVATDSGGKREIVEDGVTGLLVPQGDADSVSGALARALEDLMRDPERRASLGREGRRLAFERFTVGRAAREVEAVYEELFA